MSELQLTSVFPFEDVEYRVGATYEDKGMAVFYIDARAVMDRLDACATSWCDEYTLHPDGKHVECRLTVDGVTHADVGEPSEGMGDALKGAYSDALKRAAVKFGIGRYLYGLGERWVPVDNRKRFTDAAKKTLRDFYIDKTGGGDVGRVRDPAELEEPANAPAAANPAAGARTQRRVEAMPWATFWPAAREYAPDAQVKAVGAELGHGPSSKWTDANRQEILAKLEELTREAA